MKMIDIDIGILLSESDGRRTETDNKQTVDIIRQDLDCVVLCTLLRPDPASIIKCDIWNGLFCIGHTICMCVLPLLGLSPHNEQTFLL